jgi:hypothetical protein
MSSKSDNPETGDQRPETTVDPDLLWLAYPDGYLGMGGVRTIGGYICHGPWHKEGNEQTEIVFCKPDRGVCFVDGPDWTVEHTRALAEMVGDGPDDLLPLVDPDDVATWACCLRDLAEACFERKGPPPDERWWVSNWHPCLVPAVENPSAGNPDHWQSGWALHITWGTMGFITMHFDFAMKDIVDPALALVMARISFYRALEEGRG